MCGACSREKNFVLLQQHAEWRINKLSTGLQTKVYTSFELVGRVCVLLCLCSREHAMLTPHSLLRQGESFASFDVDAEFNRHITQVWSTVVCVLLPPLITTLPNLISFMALPGGCHSETIQLRPQTCE